MVIYGWTRQPTILGSKVDQCTQCGLTGPHYLIRKTWWVTIFFVPLLFLRFQHGMACANCGLWTGIPWRQVRRGMKDRRLPLAGRKRPDALDVRERVADETGHRPSEAELYDTVEVNPKRGFWDLAVKVWPVAVVALVAVIAIGAAMPPGPKPPPAKRPTAHACWYQDAGISGCRYDSGTMEGYAIGTEITCYFFEPLPTGEWNLSCEKPSVAP